MEVILIILSVLLVGTLLVPNVGEGAFLNYMTNKVAPSDLTLRLYTSNTTPGETDVAGTYTEAAGNGYGAIAVANAGWSVTTGAPSHADFAQQTFTFTGALGNVYGYYITRADGTLMWSERFTDGPYNVVNNGDQIKVTLYISAE